MIDFFTGHAGVMGQNFLTLVLGALVALYYGRLAWRTPNTDPARWLMIGVAFGGAGWAADRGFWWLWRLELALGNESAAAAFVRNADYLLIVTLLIATSYLIHLHRWTRARFGRWSWPVSVALAVGVFLIGALPGALL